MISDNQIRPDIIDVEASGFGPLSYPIEIGLVLTDGTRYATLVRPARDWTHWDSEAEKIHSIPRDLLENKGKPIQTVAAELNELLSDGTVYSDGWVVDKPWVDRLFYQSGITRLFSISPLETILSESQMDIWHQTKDRVIRELNLKRHRASTDALIIQETYARTRINGGTED